MDKLKAYSKVNLILKVFPQEKHEIKHKIHSLFCLYKPLYDDVLIEEANKNLIVFKQEGKVLKIDKTKTILAIEYLSKLLKRSINLRIIINKRIPVMSGLGGSATDIAVIIKWITQKYHFKLTNSHLRYIALNIGSDIPFFLSHYSSA
jgi:4-diphosphocytidyl-2-C-methyl-D-erythritol kinase